MIRGQGTTYAAAGVNIDAGNSFASMVKARIAAAWPGTEGEIGGFAGGGPIPPGAIRVMGCCDGSGTKPILAALTGMVWGIGQDAVAMSAVDAFVAGARPACVLDTIAVAKLDTKRHIEIIDGVIAGCQMAGARLIGGETAELPGIFRDDRFFLVDTSVIAFPAPELAYVPMAAGQQVYGWLSYGPGANGLSLIRRAMDLDGMSWIRRLFHLRGSMAKAQKRLEQHWPELGGRMLAEAVLRPTPIYIKQADALREAGAEYAGHAHITGGGLLENIPRILPSHLKVQIGRGLWPRPAIFPLVQRLGNVPDYDMERTLNQGIMMVSVVAGDCDDTLLQNLGISGVCRRIGQVLERQGNEPQVELVGEYNDNWH